MNQSNALKRLQIILNAAIANRKENNQAVAVLLTEMKLPITAANFVSFYEILGKASKEAELLASMPTSESDDSLKVLAQLNNLFIEKSPWQSNWIEFKTQLLATNTIVVLKLLASEFSRLSPKSGLEQDFLKELCNYFDELLQEIYDSDLPRE